jgi:carbonic anhydrase/acetyltransferase-like protein (isoleucine patch superfamily)
MSRFSVLVFPKQNEPGLLALNGRCKSMVPVLGGSRIVDFFIGPPLAMGDRRVSVLTDKTLPALQDYLTYRYGGQIGSVQIGGFRGSMTGRSGCLVLRAGGVLLADWPALTRRLQELDQGLHAVKAGDDVVGYYAADAKSMEGFTRVLASADESNDVDSLWGEIDEELGEGGRTAQTDARFYPLERVVEYVEFHFSMLDSPELMSDLLSALPSQTETGGSYIGPEGRVVDSFLAPSCTVSGSVERSILFPNVRIASGARVSDSIVLANNHIGEGAHLQNTVVCETTEIFSKVAPNIGDRCVIGETATSGRNDRYPDLISGGLTLIGENVSVPKACRIARNCYIDSNVDRGSLRVLGSVPAGETVLSER